MVPIPANHLANVAYGDVLPWILANVLPAGDFLKHQEAEFVAGIEKVARLRVVRSANQIDVRGS